MSSGIVVNISKSSLFFSQYFFRCWGGGGGGGGGGGDILPENVLSLLGTMSAQFTKLLGKKVGCDRYISSLYQRYTVYINRNITGVHYIPVFGVFIQNFVFLVAFPIFCAIGIISSFSGCVVLVACGTI